MIDLQGADRLIQRLEDIAEGRGVLGGLQKACAFVETDAKKRAPKDNG